MSALREKDERHNPGVSSSVIQLSVSSCSYFPLFTLNDEATVNDLFQDVKCSSIKQSTYVHGVFYSSWQMMSTEISKITLKHIK